MKVTIEDAHSLAKRLKEESPRIRNVELFGSVLRNGIGRDLDLILTVDEGLSREFWSSASGLQQDLRVTGRQGWLMFRRIVKKLFPGLDEFFIRGNKRKRQMRASRLIGIDLASLGERYRPGTNLDVWLLPFDWHVKDTVNLPVLSRIGDFTNEKSTLLFLARVARSTKRIA